MPFELFPSPLKVRTYYTIFVNKSQVNIPLVLFVFPYNSERSKELWVGGRAL